MDDWHYGFHLDGVQFGETFNEYSGFLEPSKRDIALEAVSAALTGLDWVNKDYIGDEQLGSGPIDFRLMA